MACQTQTSRHATIGAGMGTEIRVTPAARAAIAKAMGPTRRLARPVLLSVARGGEWTVDVASPRPGAVHVTVPSGYDWWEVGELLRAFAREVGQGSRGGWSMPPLCSTYLCDDGRWRTLAQMLYGIDEDLRPRDGADLDMLLFSFGCDRDGDGAQSGQAEWRAGSHARKAWGGRPSEGVKR